MKLKVIDSGNIPLTYDFFLTYEVSAVACCCDGCSGDLMHGSSC